MKEEQTIVLPDKIDECHEMIKRQAERMAWLEQRLFGSKKDRAFPYEGPTLFDDLFKEAEKSVPRPSGRRAPRWTRVPPNVVLRQRSPPMRTVPPNTSIGIGG